MVSFGGNSSSSITGGGGCGHKKSEKLIKFYGMRKNLDKHIHTKYACYIIEALYLDRRRFRTKVLLKYSCHLKLLWPGLISIIKEYYWIYECARKTGPKTSPHTHTHQHTQKMATLALDSVIHGPNTQKRLNLLSGRWLVFYFLRKMKNKICWKT